MNQEENMKKNPTQDLKCTFHANVIFDLVEEQNISKIAKDWIRTANLPSSMCSMTSRIFVFY